MKLSVIIPVKNGEATLVKCLSAIKNQTIADNIEIIILDTQSTDTSLQIAKTFGAKTINILPSDFNHGLTRNLGIQHANGELLYYTVQDAYLAEEDQLEKMAAHFTDYELQAVVGMQAIPHDIDKNPARWFKRFTKPETIFRHFPDRNFGQLPLQEQFTHCTWDNVNAMYRKSALQEIPFIKTDFAEDWLWVKDALTVGMKIAFDPSLVAFHYHHLVFKYSFKVQYIVNYNFYKQFNVYPNLPFLLKPILSTVLTIAKRKELSFKDKLYWVTHNFLGLIGDYSSRLTFLTISKILGDKVLDTSYKRFISDIPQGKNKG